MWWFAKQVTSQLFPATYMQYVMTPQRVKESFEQTVDRLIMSLRFLGRLKCKCRHVDGIFVTFGTGCPICLIE